MPKIGHPAPDFTLPTQNGHPIALSDLRGQQVVVFTFPQATSAITQKHLQAMCALHDEIQMVNRVIYGIGMETEATLRTVHDANDLPFDLLSDPTHATLTQYDAWDDLSFKARSFASVLRTYWVIDATGKLIAGQARITVQMCVNGVKSALKS